MLIIFLRSLILYIVIFLVIRLMGKKEMSKVQPFELAIIILIADLASSPMSSRSTSIFDGIIPMVTLLICYIIFTFVIQTNNKVQEVVCGKVTMIIKDGKIIESELKKQQYTIGDLMSQLRQKDVFKISDVKYGLIETNGNFNVITNDINNLPVNIIEDGCINENSLTFINYTSDKVNSILIKNNLKLENILVGSIDENDKFSYQLKEEV
ncbi:MAG: DUF421 domain-containing protein [Clostridia bacterium]